MAARRRRENMVVVVLAVLAVLGGGHAVYSVFAPDPKPPGDEAMVTVAGHAQLAGSFARDFVQTYLSATSSDRDALARFVDGTRQIALPKTAQKVSDPVVVYQARTFASNSVDVWSVTVSVRVDRQGSRQYYRVPVSLAQGTLRALNLPAVVAPPAAGATLAQGYSASCGEETPFSRVAAGFLDAYLTGKGDITRYVTVDSGLAALRPAPFTELSTVAVTAQNGHCGAEGSSARILATATPKNSTGTAPALAFPLTMVQGEGQWQVRAIDELPALREPLSVVAPEGGESDAAGGGIGATTTAPTTAVRVPPATQN